MIDVILTNKPKTFQKTHSFVTWISNFYKLAVTVLKYYFTKLPQRILYTNDKNFGKTTFLQDLGSRFIQGELYYNSNDLHNKLMQIFLAVFD